MKIIVCDDSKRDAEYIRDVLVFYEAQYAQSIQVYTDSTKLLSKYKLGKTRCDLLFLDIDMPELDGLKLGKEIKKIDPDTIIVFTTSYPQYAIDAYDCEAFNYIVKPCKEHRLLEIFQKAIIKYQSVNKMHQIKFRNQIHAFPINSIYYIECCNKHIIYHFQNPNQRLEAVENLSDVYSKLSEYGFYQVHQGYIVNFNKVQDFLGSKIVLDNQKSVDISIRKRKEVMLAYAKYMEKKL